MFQDFVHLKKTLNKPQMTFFCGSGEIKGTDNFHAVAFKTWSPVYVQLCMHLQAICLHVSFYELH